MSSAAGFTYSGEDWGAAWGDLDGDGYPDLWTGNHTRRDWVYRNNRDGTFTEVGKQVDPIPTDHRVDTHGAAWADYDNDGREDLVQLVGNRAPFSDGQFLLHNDGGTFSDATDSAGLRYPAGGGRSPVWLDVNGDGRLDILVPTLRRPGGTDAPSAVFEQTAPGAFTDVTEQVGEQSLTHTTHFGELSHLAGAGFYLLLQSDGYQFPTHIFRVDSLPWNVAAPSLGVPDANPGQDAAIADLNNDGIPDIFIAGGPTPASLDVQDTSLTARLQPRDSEQGVRFGTTGLVTLTLRPVWRLNQLGLDHVFIGSGGAHPTSFTMNLSASDPANQGIAAHTPGVDNGIYIGYDMTRSRWSVSYSGPSGKLLAYVGSSADITNVQPLGFDPSAYDNNHLYLSSPSSYVDATTSARVDVPHDEVNVAAGDFNNDGLVDLFVVRTTGTSNGPDVILQNMGDGTFLPVKPSGAEGSAVGQGGTVALADYDRDGYLDAVVTNGRTPSVGGPTLLFHNNAGPNHWLELDLQGTSSNRDAVGARVFATTGCSRQLREQNGGMHERGAQNLQRLHFGLGASERLDALTVYWPSGTVQTLTGVPADEVLTLVEPAASSPGS